MNSDMPVQVPVDDPNADTEWNDILRSKGIIPEKSPSPTPQIEAALVQARELAHEHRLEGKDLDELDELEDEEDEDFLDSYRQKRMAELGELSKASVYGMVYPVQKAEYNREVTETSNKAWVFVLLTSSTGMNTESKVAEQVWRELAGKYGEVKFCQMRAGLCIEGYPDKNTPTVLCYREGDIRRQIVTLGELGGVRTGIEDVEKVLLGLGVVPHSDMRLKRRDEDEDEAPGRSIRDSSRKQATVDSDDSDFD